MTTNAKDTHAKDRGYSRKEVVTIIESALSNLKAESATEKKLHEELTALSSYIQSMRAELAQLRSIEISHNHVPAATDELEAVVAETAKATGLIMDACEHIEKVADQLEDSAQREEVSKSVTAIYEACGFQDITGQRITKVVRTIENIERKVGEILSAFGHEHPVSNAPEKEKEESLLNGPQIGGPAVSQSDIDALLASFDEK